MSKADAPSPMVAAALAKAVEVADVFRLARLRRMREEGFDPEAPVPPELTREAEYAMAISTFLEALPNRDLLSPRMHRGMPGSLHRLAAAARAAGRAGPPEAKDG